MDTRNKVLKAKIEFRADNDRTFISIQKGSIRVLDINKIPNTIKNSKWFNEHHYETTVSSYIYVKLDKIDDVLYSDRINEKVKQLIREIKNL